MDRGTDRCCAYKRSLAISGIQGHLNGFLFHILFSGYRRELPPPHPKHTHTHPGMSACPVEGGVGYVWHAQGSESHLDAYIKNKTLKTYGMSVSYARGTSDLLQTRSQGKKKCLVFPLLVGFKYEMIKSLIFSSTAAWVLLPRLGLGSPGGVGCGGLLSEWRRCY